MNESTNVNNIFSTEVTFEEEYTKAKLLAVDYKLCAKNAFRNMITNSCINAYESHRSVQGFVKIASALIKDEEDYFKKYNIPVQQLFISSLRSQDTDLELLREENNTDPNHQVNVKKHTEALTGMINGLVEQGALSIDLCKTHFSSQLVEDAKIITSKTLFERCIVRFNTSVKYTQKKFNLFREINEGYSYLIDDLIHASIGSSLDSNGKLSGTPMEKIPELLGDITRRIGAFHLDPNRVLDIILDLFIKQLTFNYKFWIELIKQSDWIQKLTVTDDNGEEITIIPSAIMAELIGFRFYNYHEIGSTPAPKELYLATAILLKNNLISFGNILPRLYPNHDAMVLEKNDYSTKMNKEITSNTSGKLAMYGTLGEEGETKMIKRTPAAPSPPPAADDAKTKKVYKANDVIELVKSLVSIGDLRNAEMILFRYEKLVEMHPEIALYIYRICSAMLQPAYEAFVRQKKQDVYKIFEQQHRESKLKTALATPDKFNPKIPEKITLKRVIVTDALLDDVEDFKKMERYEFFYKECHNEVGYCETAEHLTTRFMPLMRLAGYKTYLAIDLLNKLVLIVKALIERENEFPGGRIHCLHMLRDIFLPAISFSKNNPGTIANIWEIVRRLTLQERYSLYGEWGNEFYKKTTETKLLKARVERSVKTVMRTICTENVRNSGRDLGKLANSNPMIVFNVILDQVQSFDNMAPLLGTACRYLGKFSIDVIGYVLTEKWTGFQDAGRNNKMKEKEDGTPSNWLKSLAVFTGMLYKTHGYDSVPLLRYMACRLRCNDPVADLVLLNEFVTKMGEIEILASAYTNDQITATGCSDFLKAEAFLPICTDNHRASHRVLDVLKQSLKRDNVGFEILVLLHSLKEAWSREMWTEEKVLPASERFSKLDRVNQTQLQYLELLTSLFDGDELVALIPNVDVLVRDYRLPLDTAMTYNRRKARFAITQNMDTPIEENKVWTPFKAMTETVGTLLPNPPVPSMFTSELYVVFWQLSLYDLHYPVAQYEAAIERHKETIRQCQDTRSPFCFRHRLSDVQKVERRARASLEVLKVDLPKHKAHVKKVMAALEHAVNRWFPSSEYRDDLISNILQYCVLPRSRQSEPDAVYCYKFVMLMHRLNAKNFSATALFDKVFSDYVLAPITTFTEYEVNNYSRLLSKVLSWHNGQQNKEMEYTLHCNVYISVEQALQTGEVVTITNAILVLRRFIPCFPATSEHGENIVKIVTKLSEEETRSNIKVLARSYIGLITKYKEKWVTKNQFMGIQEPTPPVEVKIAHNSSSNTKYAGNASATAIKNESGIGHDHEESSRRHNDKPGSIKHRSSSKHTSPIKRDEINRSSNPARQLDDKKGTREADPLPPEKSRRLDDNSCHYSTAPSSSRNSPKDNGKHSTSRMISPLHETVGVRNSAKKSITTNVRAEQSSSRREDRRPVASPYPQAPPRSSKRGNDWDDDRDYERSDRPEKRRDIRTKDSRREDRRYTDYDRRDRYGDRHSSRRC